MASITKHVGRVGDKKVAVVFREVPGESHMALVVWTQTINRYLHDAIMDCIMSDAGQSSENLADALSRVYTRDGKLVLNQLHNEGLLKKIQTELVIMTPTPSNKTDIKLSELNSLINKMNEGEEAAKALQEMDRSRGLQDPIDVARRMRESKSTSEVKTPESSVMYRNDDMSDAAIAHRLRQQATKMAVEARGLMAESERMLKEASSLDGTVLESDSVSHVKSTKSKKESKVVVAKAEIVMPDAKTITKAKRGRPQKSTVTLPVEL